MQKMSLSRWRVAVRLFRSSKMWRTEIRHKDAALNYTVSLHRRQKVTSSNNHPIICEDERIRCNAVLTNPVIDRPIERKCCRPNVFSDPLLNVALFIK